jgi:phenylacetate-CoA ligase
MIDWLRLYHHAPYPIRMAAASLRGYRLRKWRYGPETDRLVSEALERESWSWRQWEAWQQERLAYILRRAATQVPYYRSLLAGIENRAEENTWDQLENWPILPKEPLRENPYAFLADGCDPLKMSNEHTSGTSGKPLNLWRSRTTDLEWYALFEARVRIWNGINRNDPWAIVGGQLVAPFHQTQPPFWVWNAGLQQLYMSAYHLSPQNVPAYLIALDRHKVVSILGYASSLYTLAQIATEKNLPVPPQKVIISNAEPLFEYQRQFISKVFQCRVVDTYGMSEITAAASECQYGQMHLWPEVGIVEVFEEDEDKPVNPGEMGRLIQTGLLNSDMPLIRYEVGDRGTPPMNNYECACGRQLPVINQIEGRLDDVVITRDGRRIGRLDPVFKADFPIREAQIIQENLDIIRVNIVPAPGYSDETERLIVRNLIERVGDMEIHVEKVPEIPRSSNGKFRAVISKVTRFPESNHQSISGTS